MALYIGVCSPAVHPCCVQLLTSHLFSATMQLLQMLTQANEENFLEQLPSALWCASQWSCLQGIWNFSDLTLHRQQLAVAMLTWVPLGLRTRREVYSS